MKQISINASTNYEVIIGRGLLTDAGTLIANVLSSGKLCIITDDIVDQLYAQTLTDSLRAQGFALCQYTIAHGEGAKTLTTCADILEYLASENMTRSDAIIALGGGVVGDISGFVASTYCRGINFVQIPTTLLAALDSSVGGKTGVNLNHGKNLAGTFWQPALVLCDCDLFKSLSRDLMLDGISEAIKYGVILDATLFDFIEYENVFLDKAVAHLIARCIAIKSEIVEKDERESELRQLLNFGHTIGHAIEKCSNYQISHGHAVAMGMLIIAKAADQLGYSAQDCGIALETILNKYAYPLDCPFSPKELAAVALNDKKRAGEQITLVLPTRIGECELKKIHVSELEHLIAQGLRK